ncbi:MAG: hypothetical protein JNM47_17345 [Hyphomonadaceae bacterium]|nr:hypothetical protein [Hyphomonadaceae bacterium]
MLPEAQMRVLLLAGAAGGALRMASAFVPYEPESIRLESLYAAIDVALLLGLVGIHQQAASRTGAAGLAFFALSVAALASIVGPDPTMFGVDFYRVGASVFALALAGFAVTLLVARVHAITAVLWIACAVSGVLAATGSPLAFMIAGLALGAGFVAAALPTEGQSALRKA